LAAGFSRGRQAASVAAASVAPTRRRREITATP
jgi:hypothetical protein